MVQQRNADPLAYPESCNCLRSEPDRVHEMYAEPDMTSQRSDKRLVGGCILFEGRGIPYGDYFLSKLHDQTIQCYGLNPLYPYVCVCDTYGNRFFN